MLGSGCSVWSKGKVPSSITMRSTPLAHTSTLFPSYPLAPFLLLMSSGDMYTGVLQSNQVMAKGAEDFRVCEQGTCAVLEQVPIPLQGACWQPNTGKVDLVLAPPMMGYMYTKILLPGLKKAR